MSLESHDNGPEKSTAEKARDYLREGAHLSLSNVMPKLGDDGSFIGRINFIKRNPKFVTNFNKNKPEDMPPLDTKKDAYGYKGTEGQNMVYLQTYLEIKAAEPEKKVEVKEVAIADPDKDPSMPANSEEDLDAYLSFLPKKEEVNTGTVSEVEIHTYREDLGSNETATVSPVTNDPANPKGTESLVVSDKKPVVDVKAGPLADVLGSEAPNDRAATLVKALASESGDMKYLVEAWPMALSAAATTVQEGLQSQGLNPYDTLANTVSASLKSGDVVLNLKDGRTITTALLPEDAWYPAVDIREGLHNAPIAKRTIELSDDPIEYTAAELAAKARSEQIASINASKDKIPDPSVFRDDEEFQFDDDATFTASAKKDDEPGKKDS